MSQQFRVSGWVMAVVVSMFGVVGLLKSPARSAIPDLETIQYVEPPTTSAGRSRSGGGGKTASHCPAMTVALTPLVRTKTEDLGGRTVSPHPTLWFYSPYTRAHNLSMTFALRDQVRAKGEEAGDNVVWRKDVPLPETPGIVSVQIPPNTTLKANQVYEWSMTVSCSSPPLEVWGWIQRVEDLQTATKSVGNPSVPKSLQKAGLYAKHGIWFDAITTLVELHRSNPQSEPVARNLRSLLVQGGIAPTVAEEAIAK